MSYRHSRHPTNHNIKSLGTFQPLQKIPPTASKTKMKKTSKISQSTSQRFPGDKSSPQASQLKAITAFSPVPARQTRWTAQKSKNMNFLNNKFRPVFKSVLDSKAAEGESRLKSVVERARESAEKDPKRLRESVSVERSLPKNMAKVEGRVASGVRFCASGESWTKKWSQNAQNGNIFANGVYAKNNQNNRNQSLRAAQNGRLNSFGGRRMSRALQNTSKSTSYVMSPQGPKVIKSLKPAILAAKHGASGTINTVFSCSSTQRSNNSMLRERDFSNQRNRQNGSPGAFRTALTGAGVNLVSQRSTAAYQKPSNQPNQAHFGNFRTGQKLPKKELEKRLVPLGDANRRLRYAGGYQRGSPSPQICQSRNFSQRSQRSTERYRSGNSVNSRGFEQSATRFHSCHKKF